MPQGQSRGCGDVAPVTKRESRAAAISLWTQTRFESRKSTSGALDLKGLRSQQQLQYCTDHSGTEATTASDEAASQPEHRTGTVLTATAHLITTVIGSGILSLTWAISTMGWVAGPVLLLAFAAVTWYTSLLLTDAHRHPKGSGPRNRTYPEAVQAILGSKWWWFCASVQYTKIVVINVGDTITAGISMVAVRRAHCFHSQPQEVAIIEANGGIACQVSNSPFMLMFGAFQIILSQIPHLDDFWLMSVVVALVSFAYTSIGLGLSIGKTSESGHSFGSLGGRQEAPVNKVWAILTGLGSFAFAYEFSIVLLEIQDTLKPTPSGCRPTEGKQMKQATNFAILVTTAFYLSLGCLGYSAFGDQAPINLLNVGSSGEGFVKPQWLVDCANVFVIINMLGGYQVLAQPWFAFVENAVYRRFGRTHFTHTELVVSIRGTPWLRLTLFRLVWRTAYVCLTTLAMLLPFFNDVVGLIGAMGFWPLAVFLPIEMHIRQAEVPIWQCKWVCLQTLSIMCAIVSLAAGVGAVAQIIVSCKDFVPFQTHYNSS
ncbi:TPA: Amino acid permease [Trebouxia sp. C0004]